MANDIQNIVSRYIDAWNETQPVQRQAIVAEVFSEDASYTDPLASVRGRTAIDQFIAGAQTQFPGLHVSVAGGVDAHHEQARFAWHLLAPGQTDPVAIGFDVIALDGDRIGAVYGFLDKLPSLA